MEKEDIIVDKCIENIIESSTDNCSGLVMSKDSITKVVNQIHAFGLSGNTFSKSMIDDIMGDNEDEEGFLVKCADFVFAIEFYGLCVITN